MKRKAKVEYDIEKSPFYTKSYKTRASLTELKASSSEDVVLARKRTFKKDEYTKFIINDRYDIQAYHKLSSSAKTILHHIMYACLEYNSPTFRLTLEDITSIIDIGESTYYRSIGQLIEIKYIAKTKTKEVYWINHNKFYKGNFITDKYLKEK